MRFSVIRGVVKKNDLQDAGRSEWNIFTSSQWGNSFFCYWFIVVVKRGRPTPGRWNISLFIRSRTDTETLFFSVFFFAFCFLIFILFFCHRNSCPLMEGRGVAETRPWPKVWRRKSACYAARFHSTLCVHPLPAFLLVLDVIETQPWPRKVSTAEKSFFFVFEKKRHDPIQRKTFRPFLFFSFSLSFGYFFC